MYAPVAKKVPTYRTVTCFANPSMMKPAIKHRELNEMMSPLRRYSEYLQLEECLPWDVHLLSATRDDSNTGTTA